MLLRIYFTRGDNQRRKSDRNKGRLTTVELNDSHDHFFTVFSLLKCQHTHVFVGDAKDRERLSQSTRMLRTLKRDQRLIKPLRFPVTLCTTPITSMRQKPVNNLVPSPVLG